MKHMFKVKNLLLIMLMLSVTVAFSQKQISLKYKLSPGDQFKFKTEVEQEITFDANGTSMVMDMVVGTSMTSDVVAVEDGQIENSYVIDALKLNQKAFGMEMKYDSEDSSTYSSGPGAQIAAKVGSIIGKSIIMIMDDYGNIDSINMSSITENDEFTQGFKNGSYYAAYPEHKIKVGDSWEVDINPMQDSEMLVHTTYTLVKVKKREAVIKVVGSITGNTVNGEEVKMDGKTEGEMIVNRKTGMQISSTFDVDMSLEMEQQGMKIPATIMGTSTTTVNKVK